jgi:equilibrative nucleoside transporter 1/2/3
MYVDAKKNELSIKSYTPIADVATEWMKKMDSTVSATSSEAAFGDEESDGEDAERSFQVEGLISNEIERTQQCQEQSIVAVWKVVKQPALALFLTYLVTLAIFPVITSDLTSVHECLSDARIHNDMFVPLTFLTFNLGDLLGRFVVADNGVEKHRRQIPRKLVWGSLARLAFIPIFFLCYSRKSLYSDIAIQSDFFSWTVQMAFAVSNGVVTTAAFSVVAILVPPDESMQQVASSILNLSLCLGLVAGGLIASPLLWLFTGHW